MREMREIASTLLTHLDDRQRAAACHAFSDDTMRRWIEYRPRPRPGVSLADLSGRARKSAHRLLATALSTHAYAQAMTIISLEEVLDRTEGWARGRHSEDYWAVVFGDPGRDDRWGWRFEGHHLSVAVTVDRARADIASEQQGRVPGPVLPLGVPGHGLGPTARALLDRLVALYLDRLPAALAAQEAARVDRD